MTTPGRETTAAWHELCEGLRALDGAFLAGPRAVGSDRAAAEGYRAALTALGVAADLYLFADPARPMFVDVATPLRRDRRWGGDNTDCWYGFTPIDPHRSYRVRGQRGDSAYFCFTVYNEPSPGAWADRIVVHLNDTDLAVDADGRFEFVVGPSRPAGYDGLFVPLDDDAAIAFTRDYQVDPRAGRRVAWEIEALDPPGPLDRSDERTAAGLRATLRWVQMLFGIVPLALATADPDTTLGHTTPVVANEFADPYRVVDATYGWSARRRDLRVRQLRPRGGRGAGDHPPAARLPVLEPRRLEPVHGHRVAARRHDLDQHGTGGARRRRHGDDRRGPRAAGAPQRGRDGRAHRGGAGVPVVPGRRGPRAPDAGGRPGGRRADRGQDGGASQSWTARTSTAVTWKSRVSAASSRARSAVSHSTT